MRTSTQRIDSIIPVGEHYDPDPEAREERIKALEAKYKPYLEDEGKRNRDIQRKAARTKEQNRRRRMILKTG